MSGATYLAPTIRRCIFARATILWRGLGVGRTRVEWGGASCWWSWRCDELSNAVSTFGGVVHAKTTSNDKRDWAHERL